MTSDQTQPLPKASLVTKRRFWSWLALFTIGVALAAAVAFYLNYVRDIPLQISAETTYITEPLTGDGRVDYFTAAESLHYPPELATDENGFRLLVQSLDVSSDASPEQRRQIYEKLGLDPSLSPTLTYEDPHLLLMDFVRAEAAAGNLPPDMDSASYERELFERLDGPWTRDDLPMLSDWLDQNAAALDLLGEAVRKPVFCVPWTRTDEDALLYHVALADVQRIRGFARGYQSRAMYRLGAGDIEGAIDDIISCARLGRHLQNGGIMIEDLVGIACEAIAFSIGPGSSLEHQPTEEQWLRFQGELNRLPERKPIEATLEIERIAALEIYQQMAWGESISETADLMQGRSFGVDWNIVMQQANENFNDLERGVSHTMPDTSSIQWNVSRGDRSRIFGHVISGLVLPAIELYQEARRRTVCKENLLRITLAMLIYERKNGTLPPAYTFDEQGNPLHSWRVLLLPYLGYDELYSQIRLDEPWDSPHNQAFHMADVPIYQCPSADLTPGQTEYTVIEGATCAFDGGEGKSLDAFGPNSVNMILVAERLDPVCWMDPTQEISFADACLGINRYGATTGIGSEHVGGAHFGFRSGAVRFISENISIDSLPKLFEGTMDEAY